MEDMQKNNVLLVLSELLRLHRKEIMQANRYDISAFPDMDVSMRDRLTTDEKKIDGMIRSLADVAAQPDPEGKLLYEYRHADGLHVVNRTVPFGTILIVYESRPDVTVEAAATAFKAGNRILLKGGKESLHTNLFLTRLWKQALSENGIDETFVEYLNLSHSETQKLIKENTCRADLIIPRGGDALIDFVKRNASVPVLVSGRGNNFMYVDEECDFEIAVRLAVNGKSRISVCNALDKILIHENMNGMRERLAYLVLQLEKHDIEVWGDSRIARLVGARETNDEAVLFKEFLAPKIYLSLVQGINYAINVINHCSGGHSAVIVTDNFAKAALFMEKTDCAAVYHNASTRFTDGGQFGVGAEMAISTQKLHFRGPLGAQQLVTNKWFVYGNGQIRE